MRSHVRVRDFVDFKCCNSSNGQVPATTTITAPAAATRTVTAPAAATTSGGKLLHYAPAQPSSIYSLALNCPDADGQMYTASSTDQTFAITCGLGLNYGDIANIVAYTLADCIDACASVNNISGNNTACSKVEFNAFLAQGATPYGNCWIKTAAAVSAPQSSGKTANLLASAQLTNT